MAGMATTIADLSAFGPDRQAETAPRPQGDVGRSLSLERALAQAMPSQSRPMGPASPQGIHSFVKEPVPGWGFHTAAKIHELLDRPSEWDSHGAMPVDLDLPVLIVSLLTEIIGPDSPEPAVERRRSGGIQLAWHSDDPRSRFRELADEWERDTCFLSSTTKMVMHPAYQRIIGMGPAAIPLILRKLKENPDHWFWALQAITGHDPIESSDWGDLRKMTDAWLGWADRSGIIY